MSISEASSLPQLAFLAAGLPALHRELWSMLDEVPLPPEARAQLLALARARGLTVHDFLRSKALHERLPQKPVLAAFQAWLAKQASAGPADELGRLIQATGIPDVERWTLGLLLPSCPPHLAHRTLGKLPRLRQFELGEVSDALRSLARRADAARMAAPAPLLPSGNAALDALRARLSAARELLRSGWPPGLLQGSLALQPEGDGLLLELELGDPRLGGDAYLDAWDDEFPAGLPPWARRPQSGVLRIDSLPAFEGRVHCFCRAAECVHRAVTLDLLLGELAVFDGRIAKLVSRMLVPRWQRALDELAGPGKPVSKKQVSGTLSFVASPDRLRIFFHAQGKRGPSKQGQEVPFYGLATHVRKLQGLDRRIAEALVVAEAARGEDSPLYGDALLLLVGHPTVRAEREGPPLPVVVERASVRVAGEAEGVAFSVLAAGQPLDGRAWVCSEGAVILRPGAGEVRLVVVPHEVRRLAEVLHQHGPRFPREALPQLVKMLPRLEEVAAVELPEELVGVEEPAALQPMLRIDGSPPALTLSIRAEPLPGGPLFVPGQGVPLATTYDGARRRFVRRALQEELEQAAAVQAQLGLAPAEGFTWRLEQGEAGIETLRRVQHLGLHVEWNAPRPRFTRPAELSGLKLRIKKKRDWFGLDGEVEIDERRVTVAALLEAARARRRFVQLAPGDYAELSEQLIEKLAPLSHLAADSTLTLGALPLIEALQGEVQSLDAEAGWMKLMQRLVEAREKPWPLPDGLLATLRDYQHEGYRWLSRLADWGAGACLADDMGLGKTLQALALLLQRAPLGPALVVAPSSVLHTWRTEAARFAPGLRLHLFHEGERDLAAFGPGDVVVVSWTLLAREAALFGAGSFATAVLDEAHAIKNAGTLRARAAHGLSAGFVLALSGTPVENHAGELWSLFRAVMPSLLGSEESFRARFLGGREGLRALGQLVQPFVLRRTKAEVARELPPRTDLDVLVPLSPEERSLYDDVRLAAASDLGSLTGEQQRFQVLAALTRLRLTACHPRLQDKDWKGPASKLARLLELVRDLTASGHRALVFSQFTQHLALVAEALRAEGIAFSYLDGQVPLAQRQERVEAFQEGRGGELFLISLKAGGTGLTLTAADYVIHLDPWWNPAVEDQASDRAHRIGQTKPVTVYRLIAEGTIEQQILSLHREKRELVDALLSGTDRAGKLTAEELAGLIRAS